MPPHLCLCHPEGWGSLPHGRECSKDRSHWPQRPHSTTEPTVHFAVQRSLFTLSVLQPQKVHSDSTACPTGYTNYFYLCWTAQVTHLTPSASRAFSKHFPRAQNFLSLFCAKESSSCKGGLPGSGFSCSLKVCFMETYFYEKHTLIPVFTNPKKTKKDFAFTN